MSERYGGWANRETWATRTHIDQDELLLADVLSMANHAPDEYDFRGKLKEHILDFYDDVFGDQRHKPSAEVLRMVRDIGSEYRIDWDALGKHYWEQRETDEEGETAE